MARVIRDGEAGPRSAGRLFPVEENKTPCCRAPAPAPRSGSTWGSRRCWLAWTTGRGSRCWAVAVRRRCGRGGALPASTPGSSWGRPRRRAAGRRGCTLGSPLSARTRCRRPPPARGPVRDHRGGGPERHRDDQQQKLARSASTRASGWPGACWPTRCSAKAHAGGRGPLDPAARRGASAGREAKPTLPTGSAPRHVRGHRGPARDAARTFPSLAASRAERRTRGSGGKTRPAGHAVLKRNPAPAGCGGTRPGPPRSNARQRHERYEALDPHGEAHVIRIGEGFADGVCFAELGGLRDS